MEFPDKLAAFTEVDDAQIQADTHFRYTYAKSQGHGERKCVYAVCTERADDSNIVKGYKLRMTPGNWTPAINTRSFDSTPSTTDFDKSLFGPE